METFIPSVYANDCPTRHVLDLIGDKWAALIVGLLEGQPQRFAALHRQIGGISQKMLTQTLRRLERDGLVHRTVYAEVPPRVEYRLTPLGQTLCAPLAALRMWAEHNIAAVQEAQQRYDRSAAPSPERRPAGSELDTASARTA
jgi:DNA-binding HxlR family transcriptional regulator